MQPLEILFQMVDVLLDRRVRVRGIQQIAYAVVFVIRQRCDQLLLYA